MVSSLRMLTMLGPLEEKATATSQCHVMKSGPIVVARGRVNGAARDGSWLHRWSGARRSFRSGDAGDCDGARGRQSRRATLVRRNSRGGRRLAWVLAVASVVAVPHGAPMAARVGAHGCIGGVARNRRNETTCSRGHSRSCHVPSEVQRMKKPWMKRTSLSTVSNVSERVLKRFMWFWKECSNVSWGRKVYLGLV